MQLSGIMQKRLVFILLFTVADIIVCQAQRNEIFNERIKTLQVIVNNDCTVFPAVMRLDSDDELYIGFDDLTHTYHRYIYKIEHCEADWTISDQIFESDYLAGFNGNTIDDEPEQSLNTTVLYNHYSIYLPNQRCSLKMSGNYRLTVYDDDNDEKMFSVCFMVLEQKMSVSLSVTGNTDTDIYHSHQQVEMSLNYGSINITDHDRQICTVVMQNGRWDNAVMNLAPTYIKRDGLSWSHNKGLIFDAGNEYSKFEMLDVHALTMGIDHRRNYEDYYHTFLFPISERRNYVYDEDADGAFVIRNADNDDVDYLCDYEFVHYAIESPRLHDEVYLNGNWTNDLFADEYKMEYNIATGCYEAIVLQKQGYYNYQALVLDADGRTHPLPSQGNFYETENNYQALVYYKGNTDRTWKLVGYTSADFNKKHK